jgi:hypothetical protein
MDKHAAEYTAEECCEEAGQGWVGFLFFEGFTGESGIKAFHFFDPFGPKRQAACRAY